MATRKIADPEPVADVAPLPVVVVDAEVIGNTMKVAVSRSYKINMGNYESADAFVSATVDVPVDTDLEALANQFSEILDTLQAPDLTLFKALTKQKDSIAQSLA